jgi:hypothetical protein
MGTSFTYAQELTLANLRSRTLRKCRVANAIRYSPTSAADDYDWIDEALNRGLQIFVRETRCLRGYAAYVPIDGHQVYRLPEGFLDLESAYYFDNSLSDGYRGLVIKGLDELNDEVSDWRTGTGSPKYIYVDRKFGRRWFFGLVPIPNFNGTTITWDTTYGAELTEICNLTTYNEEFVELPQDGLYYCPTSQSSPGKPFENINMDVLLEYYRLPRQLDTETQYAEIPREYAEDLVCFAAGDLLENNPEDSVEFKRAGTLMKRFSESIKAYRDNRKKVLAGHNRRTTPAVWSWLKGMDFHSNMP